MRQRSGKRMLSATLVKAVLVVTGIFFAASSQARSGATLHVDIAHILQAEQLTGATWSLVTPEHGILTGAAGLKNANGAASMTPAARVHVGSVAKAVLAIGVLRLATTGQLSLDAEVSRVLPSLSFDNPWQATHPVRIRHLLEHTAGLENFRFSQVFSLRPQADTPLVQALAPSSFVVRTRPGDRFAYSNTSYQMLGMIIEAVTGARYERYLDAALLRPLGMHESTFTLTVQDGPGADPLLAMGHFENAAAHPSVPTYIRPATQFTTTAADMGRFASFLMSDGRIGGKPFIAPEWMALLSGARDTEAALAGLPGGHGLVLSTRDRHGAVGHCHPGNTVGFWAMLCVYPEQQKAYFVAVNADVEGADYDRLNKALAGALALAQPRPKQQPPVRSPAPASMGTWDGIYVPAWHAVARLAWLDTVFNAVDVGWDGERLHLAPLQGKTQALRPVGGMLFQADGRLQPSHVLFVSSEDERILSDGLRNHRKMPLASMLWLWASTALGLAGLLYVLVRGLWLLARGRLRRSSTLALPLAGMLTLLLPIPFFLTQSFLQLGDLTAASGLLALATCLLPLGMAYGLAMLVLARRPGLKHPAFDCAALLAVTQWLIVLAVWGMIPFMLWR